MTELSWPRLWRACAYTFVLIVFLQVMRRHGLMHPAESPDSILEGMVLYLWIVHVWKPVTPDNKDSESVSGKY